MAIIWIGNRTFDTGDVNQRISQAAAGFQSIGIAAGDGVALCLRNDIPFLRREWEPGRSVLTPLRSTGTTRSTNFAI